MIALGCALLLSFGTNFSNAQAVETGNIIIDPYYGYPNFGRGIVQVITSYEDLSEANIKPTVIGPAGLRFEYMVADNFGIGFDFIYNSAAITFDKDSLNSDNTVHSTYEVNAYSRRYRFQIRANYHFVQEDNFDAYVGFGAGSNTRSIRFTTDYPNYRNNGGSGSLLPFSARIALGTRYFFSDNIGLNLELGIGGPLISGGLSFKF